MVDGVLTHSHTPFSSLCCCVLLCCVVRSLNETTLDIPLDLVSVRKKLQFKPSLEDLRSKYYKSLKRFLDLPKAFKGFETGDRKQIALDKKASSGGAALASAASAAAAQNEFAQLYMYLPERNHDGVYNVYASAEQLFAQLQLLLKQHQHWVFALIVVAVFRVA
jgi:hypothetical protein